MIPGTCIKFKPLMGGSGGEMGKWGTGGLGGGQWVIGEALGRAVIGH